jgi:hypothetical protein
MTRQLSPERKEYVSKLTNPRLLLRGWLVLACLEFGALLLGIAFFIIIHGVILGVAWLVPFWKPAFIAYTKALGVKDVGYITLPIRWWHAIMIVIRMTVVLFFFYFGIKFLLSKGFLDQSLIYLICSH